MGSGGNRGKIGVSSLLSYGQALTSIDYHSAEIWSSAIFDFYSELPPTRVPIDPAAIRDEILIGKKELTGQRAVRILWQRGT